MRKIDVSHYTLTIIAAFLAFVVFSHMPNSILSWDIFGYYLYLPFTFIYHDLGLKDFSVVQDIIAKYGNTTSFYQAMWMPSGNYVMKYPMGMAILYLPWFVIGHIWALLSAYPADGFSVPYQTSLLYGSFVYTLIGLVFFRKSLRKFFGPVIVSFLLILTVFGTNYLVLTVYHGQGLMSHNYLFFLFALILWFTIRWHERPLLKYAAALGIIIGLAALSRPTEILVLIVPVFWNVYDKQSFINKFNLFISRWKDVVLIAFIILLFGSMQLVYFKVVTGKFLFNSYGNNAGEGMEFFHPYIWQVFFSFRKGWLIYTPIMGLALIGFVMLYKRAKEYFFGIVLFFIVAAYVISSWSCWWYADCFSQRSFIPMYVFLAIPLGFLLEYFLLLPFAKRAVFLTILAGLLSLNVFQSRQFLSGIIDSSRMTKAYYKAVFLKKNVSPETKKLLLLDRKLSPEQILQSERKFHSRQMVFQDFEAEGSIPDSLAAIAANGKVMQLTKESPFSPYFEVTYREMAVKEFGIIKIKARIFTTIPVDQNPVLITATFMHKGYAYYYRGYRLTTEQITPFRWNEVEVLYLTPEVRRPEDPFRVTIWLKGDYPVYVDDVSAEISEPIN